MPERTPALHFSMNLLDVPAAAIASLEFNDHPLPLTIHAVKEMNRGLFDPLEASPNRQEAARIFQEYMYVVFGLHGQGTDDPIHKARRYRSSYLRLLKGWGFDSNSMEGAVLKGWVESRFGLFPIYHKEPIIRFNSKAWIRYVEEKMASRFHNNAIYTQLDLLYTFCQWTLDRFGPGAGGCFTLYRGVNRFDEETLIEKRSKYDAIVRLNSLTSFTTLEEIAQTFGDIVFKTEVPTAKIVFYNDLFPEHPLRGENEYLALGGSYRIQILP